MSSRTLIWLAAIFVVGFTLIGIGHCGYGKLRWMQNLDTASEYIRNKFDGVDHISTDTLSALLEADPDKVLVVDARDPNEYAVSRIPGAINAEDTEAVVAALEAAGADPATIAVYCSIGYRSAELAELLEDDDDIDVPVKNVLGSIFQWANEDRALETPDGKPAEKVHPFNKTWGRLLEPAKRLEGASGVEGADQVEGAQ